MKKRVVVAMSGGVDSSTAAYLLKQQGYEVIGISLKLFHTEEDDKFARYGINCCGVQGIDDARNVAQKLGIAFYVLNCEKEFADKVIDYFCYEYISGKTPNPCIICNEKIKFGLLLKRAKELNADYVATGHYAQIEYAESSKRYFLKKGIDRERDQSYFLFSLSQEQLQYIIFPLGGYTKYKIRELAHICGLKIHNKPQSQEICFINTNYHDFIRTRINPDAFHAGPIVDTKGNILGQHKGIAFYTIGQRKRIGAYGKPIYVTAIDPKENKIIVGENSELYKETLVAENVNWISVESVKKPIKVKAKIRYKNPESEATIFPLNDNKVELKFAQPQRAITPGQAVVFYDQDIVVGGGWIC